MIQYNEVRKDQFNNNSRKFLEQNECLLHHINGRAVVFPSIIAKKKKISENFSQDY